MPMSSVLINTWQALSSTGSCPVLPAQEGGGEVTDANEGSCIHGVVHVCTAEPEKEGPNFPVELSVWMEVNGG